MTGELTPEQLEGVLESLPVEISFVDENDIVRYFNRFGKRIFPRSEAVIGMSVRNCHPKKSIDKVERILKGFREGSMEKAEFWIDLRDRKILIRYFPVRDKSGRYMGCLEVSQDITRIQSIDGEKRLL